MSLLLSSTLLLPFFGVYRANTAVDRRINVLIKLTIKRYRGSEKSSEIKKSLYMWLSFFFVSQCAKRLDSRMLERIIGSLIFYPREYWKNELKSIFLYGKKNRVYKKSDQLIDSQVCQEEVL